MSFNCESRHAPRAVVGGDDADTIHPYDNDVRDNTGVLHSR
jgi:hypothetical protein